MTTPGDQAPNPGQPWSGQPPSGQSSGGRPPASQPSASYPSHPGHIPSGLFPAGSSRPTFREPHPIRAGAVSAGLAAGALWMLCFGLLATTIRSYGWMTIAAGLVAWAVALLLVRFGDRGVAVGVSIATGTAWAIGVLIIAVVWSARGWPLW